MMDKFTPAFPALFTPSWPQILNPYILNPVNLNPKS